ncbi:GntR family transcriptional regulator [Chitinophagaceae bacterium LWZ2-11]
MEFNSNRAIYLQIAEIICDKMLTGQFKEEERIPSVREMAVSLEVNPNTVMRTFEFLQSKDIIYNKRGIGYFVSTAGIKKAMDFRKDEFVNQELPNFFKTISLLNIDFEALETMYNTYNNSQNNK